MNPLSWQGRIRQWELFVDALPVAAVGTPNDFTGTVLGTVRIDVKTGKMIADSSALDTTQNVTRDG